jgi:hypothetical protein
MRNTVVYATILEQQGVITHHRCCTVMGFLHTDNIIA